MRKTQEEDFSKNDIYLSYGKCCVQFTQYTQLFNLKMLEPDHNILVMMIAIIREEPAPLVWYKRPLFILLNRHRWSTEALSKPSTPWWISLQYKTHLQSTHRAQ